MKNSLQQIAASNKEQEKQQPMPAKRNQDPSTKMIAAISKKLLSGIALTGLIHLSPEDVIAKTTSKFPGSVPLQI
jgi:hypothetical protein